MMWWMRSAALSRAAISSAARLTSSTVCCMPWMVAWTAWIPSRARCSVSRARWVASSARCCTVSETWCIWVVAVVTSSDLRCSFLLTSAISWEMAAIWYTDWPMLRPLSSTLRMISLSLESMSLKLRSRMPISSLQVFCTPRVRSPFCTWPRASHRALMGRTKRVATKPMMKNCATNSRPDSQKELKMKLPWLASSLAMTSWETPLARAMSMSFCISWEASQRL